MNHLGDPKAWHVRSSKGSSNCIKLNHIIQTCAGANVGCHEFLVSFISTNILSITKNILIILEP